MLPRAYPHPFPATRRWTLIVAGLLAVHVVLALIALQAAWAFVELLWRTVAAGGDEFRPLLAAHLRQFRTLRVVQALLWILTAIAFLRWLARARGNLAALGATGLRYSPRQAVAAFLVPGPNLVRPPVVVGELWHASAARPPADMSARSTRVPARVCWWWGLLLATVAADGTARAWSLRSGLVFDLGPGAQALIVGQLLAAAAAILGIVIVWGVDARQDAAAWDRAPG